MPNISVKRDATQASRIYPKHKAVGVANEPSGDGSDSSGGPGSIGFPNRPLTPDQDNHTKGMAMNAKTTAHKMDETKNIKKVGSDADMRKSGSVTSTTALNTAARPKSPAEKLYPNMKTGRKAP